MKIMDYKDMKPLISYYGGKQRIASKIVEMIPEHNIYIEPFAGGLAVFYKKKSTKYNKVHIYREVVNDNNENLINMYRVSQSSETKDEFFDMCMGSLFSKSEHIKSRFILKNPKNQTKVMKAWAFWYNINCSFANILEGGWSCSKKSNNDAITFKHKKQNLKDQIERLENVYIECDDAVTIIKKWDHEDSFFYCDPPYINTNQGHYQGYTIDDYKELIECLGNIKGQFILSGYPNEYIPKDWPKKEIKAVMSASRVKTTQKERTEIVWYKFTTDKKFIDCNTKSNVNKFLVKEG